MSLIKITSGSKVKLLEKTIFSSPAAPSLDLTNGLQAFYKLDDLTDSSGNGNTLTNNGDVTFGSGKIGNAANFDGSNYFTGSSFDGNGNTFAFSAWVNTPRLGQAWIGAQFPEFVVAVNADGSVTLSDLSSWGQSTDPDLVAADTWTHVVVNCLNGFGTIFVNGIQVMEVTDPSYLMSLNAGSRGFGIVGDSAAGAQGQCSVDAVGIWNRSLSEAEVAALYNSGTGLELN